MADVVRFDQTPLTRFYMCRSCRNHLLTRESRLHRDTLLSAIVCRPNVVNVRTRKVVRTLRVLGFEVDGVRVYCNQCNSQLGMKFFQIRGPKRSHIYRKGRFLLSLRNLLYWNGNQVVSARSRRPIVCN